MATEILIPFMVFGSIFGVLYIFFTTRHRERMAMIDQGENADLFNSEKKGFPYGALRYGMLFVGVALGLFVGNIVGKAEVMKTEAAVFSLCFLFGGIALIINFFIERNLRKKDEAEREARLMRELKDQPTEHPANIL